jgi:hypothetical protein
VKLEKIILNPTLDAGIQLETAFGSEIHITVESEKKSAITKETKYRKATTELNLEQAIELRDFLSKAIEELEDLK